MDFYKSWILIYLLLCGANKNSKNNYREDKYKIN